MTSFMKRLILISSAVSTLAFASGARAFEPEDVYVVVGSLTDVTFRDWKTKAAKGTCSRLLSSDAHTMRARGP